MAKQSKKTNPAKTAKQTETKVETKKEVKKAEPTPCLCGCGEPSLSKRSLFAQGHDMKLKSLGLKVARGKAMWDEVATTSAREWIESQNWFREAEAKARDDIAAQVEHLNDRIAKLEAQRDILLSRQQQVA